MPPKSKTTSKSNSPQARSLHYVRLFQLDGGLHEMELEFSYLTGERRTIRVEAAKQANYHELRKFLLNAGARDITDEAVKAAMAAPPSFVVRLTARTGYDGEEFVLPWKTIGPNPERIVHETSLDTDPSLWQSGSFKAWREGLRGACAASSYLVFGLAVALVGPLLHLFTPASGVAFALIGDSGGGKTTLLKAAQSSFKRVAADSDLTSANSTMPGLEEDARIHNELVFGIDELGLNEDIKKLLRVIAFSMRDGRGKGRSGAAKATLGYQKLSWLVPMLVSGEDPLDKLAGRERLPGEQVRFIEIVVPKPTEGGIYDLIDSDDAGAALRFASEVDKLLDAHYGHLLPRFVEKIQRKRDRNNKKALKYEQKFKSLLIEAGQPVDVQARFLASFSKVYAAGRLGCEMGLLPFDRTALERAMVLLYSRATLVQKLRQQDEAKLIASLVHLADDPDRCVPVRGDIDNVDGRLWAITRTWKGKVTLAVIPARFTELVGAAGVKWATEALSGSGVLLRGADGRKRGQRLAKGLIPGDVRPTLVCLDLDRLRMLFGSGQVVS
ncbi:DUF927 domain-containing protein [Devosia sp.]|uniref:DUF927 domain-containing protein n=1 Tax=Devosia sp. TaxID=1871048 RepID=UPI003F6F9B6C